MSTWDPFSASFGSESDMGMLVTTGEFRKQLGEPKTASVATPAY